MSFYMNDPLSILRDALNQRQEKTSPIIQQLVTLAGELTENIIALEKRDAELIKEIEKLKEELQQVKSVTQSMQALATEPKQKSEKQKPDNGPAEPEAPLLYSKLHTNICDLLWKIGARSLNSGVQFNWDEFITGAIRLALLNSTNVDIEKLYEEAKNRD